MRPKSSYVLLIIMIAIIGVSMACEHELTMAPQQQPPTTLQPTFSSIQANILTPKCVNAGCHPGGGAPMSLQASVAFDNLVDVPSVFGIDRVEPGDADESALYLKVIGDSRTGARMPLGLPSLSQDEVDAIEQWIDDGAENN